VLVIGSGNIVHNLRQLRFDETVPEWSQQFDGQIASWIESGDDDSIVRFQDLGSLAQMAHPSYDHFLPLLYVLGMKAKTDVSEFFNSEFQMGSISMRSVIWKYNWYYLLTD
jgi:4,5-DOPA dioxygenase extradiol